MRADVTASIVRVLIIDGHLAVGRGLKALIEAIPGLCVVGLATRGERGLKQAALAPPDVALVDADLPGLCSAAVIRLLRWRCPQTRVIALGIYPERRRAALESGAHAFVLKDAGYDALRAVIYDEREAVRDGAIGTEIAGNAGGEAEWDAPAPVGATAGSVGSPAAAEERVPS